MRLRVSCLNAWLCDQRQCDPSVRLALPPRRFETAQFLKRHASRVVELQALRLACRRRGLEAGRFTDEDVFAAITDMLVSGRLHFCRATKADRAQASPSQEQEAPETTPRLEPVSKKRRRTRTAWIEIELVDEDGKPVPSVAYEIRLPDGAVLSGTLDDAGQCRVSGIDPGICHVTFPNLDQEAWARARG